MEDENERDPSLRKSREIPVTAAINILRTQCTEAVKLFSEHPAGTGLYRGYRSDNYCLEIDPTTRERTGSRNLYNALTSILPSWSEFPQRSHSVMFSPTPEIAKVYGKIYWLFPFDQSSIAHCNNRDCWYSFEYATKRLGRGISSIDYVMDLFSILIAYSVISTRKDIDGNYYFNTKVGKHFTKREYTVSNAQALLKEMKRITPAILKLCQKEIDKPKKDFEIVGICGDILKNFKGDWVEYFDLLLSPENNKIGLTTISETVKFPRVEMWTTGKCIMVNPQTDFNFYNLGDTSICGTFFKHNIQVAKTAGAIHLMGIP